MGWYETIAKYTLLSVMGAGLLGCPKGNGTNVPSSGGSIEIGNTVGGQRYTFSKSTIRDDSLLLRGEYSPVAVTIGDLDNDGDLEIIIVLTDRIVIYENLLNSKR